MPKIDPMISSIGGMIGSASIKVTPEVLVEKSSEVNTEVQKMITHFEELKELVDKTESYWIGEAGDLNRTMYVNMMDEIDEILTRLSEHPRDLVTIANKYSETELKLEGAIESLPVDILS